MVKDAPQHVQAGHEVTETLVNTCDQNDEIRFHLVAKTPNGVLIYEEA